MPRVERTNEERELFYIERLDVLNALTEVQDHDPKTDLDENKRAMAALVNTLNACDNLVDICGNLAGLAVRQGKVRMESGYDSQTRSVTLRDIRILRATLWSLLKTTAADAPKTPEGRQEQTPDIIRIRKAISRVNPVQLFYSVIHGEVFRYKTAITAIKDHNGIIVPMWKERYFGGIPEDKLPKKVAEIKRGNLTEKIARVDMGIYPDNAKRIYEILVALEKEQPVVELPGDKNVVSRQVRRAGEAEFFLRHLPKGLKPWDETKS